VHSGYDATRAQDRVPSLTTVLKMVQFLQIYLHHSKAASAALLIRLATDNIDVVLIHMHTHLWNLSWVGTLTHTTRNGEVQT